MTKPLIGIVGRPNFPEENDSLIVVSERYRKAIINCGGVPFLILPPKEIDYNKTKNAEIEKLTYEEKIMIERQLDLCDGILMPGGYKMCEHDFYILEYAIKEDIPILGICMGMQILSNYCQEVWNEKNSEEGINHNQVDSLYAHKVDIDVDSKLYKIINKKNIEVNSLHNFHAAKKGLYKICATSEDGIIEALELEASTFNIGVQWHPERLYETDENQKKIIVAFIDACIKNQKIH